VSFRIRNAFGRTRIAVLAVLGLLAIALYLYSERAAPPEPESPTLRPSAEPAVIDPRATRPPPPSSGPAAQSGRPFPDAAEPTGSDDGAGARNAGPVPDAAPPSPPEVSLQRAGARLRVALAERLSPEQLERVVSQQLIERLVATVHSLDAEPVPLRFRPLAHVPELPHVEPRGDGWTLPAGPDPRYAPYRDLFERLDAQALADLFARHEAAFDAAWRALGETPQPSFRVRLVEVLEHLAAFETPAERPRLIRPEVLYEFADPSLEALSWGRKILIRVGPEHADAIRRKARELADALKAPVRP